MNLENSQTDTFATPEIDAFIGHIRALVPGPGISLDAALWPSLNEETELRKLFTTDRLNPHLSNPHVGLVDILPPLMRLKLHGQE